MSARASPSPLRAAARGTAWCRAAGSTHQSPYSCRGRLREPASARPGQQGATAMTTATATATATAPSACYVGIDVAKAHLDLAVHGQGKPWRVANDADGIAATVRQLHTLAPT